MNKFYEDCHAVLIVAGCEYIEPCGHRGCNGYYYVDKRDGAVIHLIVSEDEKFSERVWRTDGTPAHEGQNPEEISIFVNARKIAA
jgi:hypothetical protein